MSLKDVMTVTRSAPLCVSVRNKISCGRNWGRGRGGGEVSLDLIQLIEDQLTLGGHFWRGELVMKKENIEKEEGEIRGSRGVEMIKGISGNLMRRDKRGERERRWDRDKERGRETEIEEVRRIGRARNRTWSDRP
jgi:hypothetical protein